MVNFIEVDSKNITLFTLIFLFTISLSVLLEKRKVITNRTTSLVFALIFTIFMSLTFINPACKDNVLKLCGIETSVRYAPNTIHERNGTWLGLYLNYVMNKLEEPEGYSKEKYLKY